ncbi:MAG: hypothetical protein HYV28_16595 [Ignavibacteriales bacterium]|nr:hypothetical protein [Ignavibacteriales bacterium]
MEVEILNGATDENAYIVVFRVKGKSKNIAVTIAQHGTPVLSPSDTVQITLKDNTGELVLFAGTKKPAGSFDEFRKQWAAGYQKGFRLKSPSTLVNRAIPFNRYLLDLGFDGNLHVCEIFRWRDVWSRDLGSGLVPGSLAAGQFSRARTTIEYDLNRYAKKNPRGLKATEDPSQGGSAEGTSWLTRAVWQYHLLTGDKVFLAEAAKILKPWVNAWIDRDSRDEGLLIDVTEWMDHSHFFLFPDGARILYSNVLFADLLHTFSKIEQSLGDNAEAERLQAISNRFVAGINNVMWNEKTGEYDNLSLWRKRDERSASAENALAILCGVAPEERVGRILQTIRERNWRTAGSTTIFPPMTHVELYIDHNYKMWPWWNAVEARARLRNGDIEGGIHLLECCSKTLEDEHYPGLMEELTSPEGKTEGGFAFLSAAGSYQDAIVEGLLGIEILEPGCGRIRIAPNVPGSWLDWDAVVPLPEGEIILMQKEGILNIRVTDPRVKIVEAPVNCSVEGATRAEISRASFPDIATLPKIEPLAYPPLKKRKAAVFFDSSFTGTLPAGLTEKHVSLDELIHLENMDISALIVPGNALPAKLADGTDVVRALTEFLDSGNAIVFYGATMHDRGTMGETGGIVDWYERRPTLLYHPIGGWLFKTSRDGINVKHDKETGFVNGWYKTEVTDKDWDPIKVPGLWEEHLKEAYDGWGWYRIHFKLPADAKGRTVVLDLGEIDDADWTYLNGEFIGSENGWQRFRRYALKPGDGKYAALNFGGDNVIAIQVFDGGGGGGMYIDSARISVETNEFSWVPVDIRTGVTIPKPARFSVVSWGPGGDFFNSWETSRGAFGFKVDGSGVNFTGPLSGITPLVGNVQEAFTDFAIAKPLMFQPLAFTITHRKLLIPDNGEQYPCLARIVNTRTGGEFILIPVSVTKTSAGLEVLKKLEIK